MFSFTFIYSVVYIMYPIIAKKTTTNHGAWNYIQAIHLQTRKTYPYIHQNLSTIKDRNKRYVGITPHKVGMLSSS